MWRNPAVYEISTDGGLPPQPIVRCGTLSGLWTETPAGPHDTWNLTQSTAFYQRSAYAPGGGNRGAVPQGSYLPTCDWSRTITFNLEAGEVRTSQQIRMARGANLRIHLNDPTSALSPSDAVASTRIVVGIGTPSGAFYSAPISGKNGNGRDHSITVPFDTPLFVWCSSRTLQVTDESGRAIAKLGSATYFSVPSGAPGKNFTFNIAGNK